jgi:urease accessory protein
MPRNGGDPLEAILINTAGGLTGGDRISWEIAAGEGAQITATTQACEKVYRALSGCAETSVKLSAAAGSRIAWLPQETIMFDRACFSRTLDADLAEGAEALIVEATIFGRRAMGETVDQGLFRDRWRVRCGDRLVHAEDFSIGPQISKMLGSSAVTGGDTAFATVLCISPGCEDRLEPARAILGEYGAASAWLVGQTGKLLARLHARDGYTLRKPLTSLIRLLNGEIGLPKVWSI